MSYLDTTLTFEAGYTQVNHRQVYDVIAAQMAALPAWTFIESVDVINGADTFRIFIWRNNKAVSGLTKDWHVAFQYRFTTAGTVYETGSIIGTRIFMFEDYNATTHVASKIATQQSGTIVALQADQTHPMTWDLTASSRPTAAGAAVSFSYIGPTALTTSYRLLSVISKSTIILESPTGTIMQSYIGAFDTLLSATDDPIPLLMSCSLSAQYALFGSSENGSSTRHPTLAAGDWAFLFAMHFDTSYGTPTQSWFGSSPLYSYPSATYQELLGDPSNTKWSKYLGGVRMSPCPISMHQTNSSLSSTKGGHRGYLRHVMHAPLAVHSAGDTFSVNGAVYVGLGNLIYGIVDTSV